MDSIKKVFILSGAILAFHIGSGFSSGQELLSFFVSYGTAGIFTVVILTFLIVMPITLLIINDSVDISNDIYVHYCGKKIGSFLSILVVILMSLMYSVMISGSGALLSQFFKIPEFYGSILMSVLSFITVCGGLKRTVNITGKIGPFIIFAIIFLGIYSILKGDITSIKDVSMIKKAMPNEILSGIFYGGFNMLCALPFLRGISFEIKTKLEGFFVALLSTILFITAVLTMSFGLYADLSFIGVQIPTLYIAKQISVITWWLFFIVIFLGVFTTSVPTLWTICRKLEADENNVFYKICAFFVVLFGLIMGKMPFDFLLNKIYPFVGVIGFLMILVIVIRKLIIKNNLD